MEWHSVVLEEERITARQPTIDEIANDGRTPYAFLHAATKTMRVYISWSKSGECLGEFGCVDWSDQDWNPRPSA